MYEDLGLTGNPFAFGEDNLDPGEFLNHKGIAAPEPGQGQFVQLLGDRGVGKTTHLRHWQATVGGEYCYLPPPPAAKPQLPIGPLVYWDEADRLSRRELKRALKAAHKVGATVVVGTHRDLASQASKAGFDVHTVHLDALEEATVKAWVDAHVRRVTESDRGFEIPSEVIRSVMAEAGPSLRRIGDLLHIWVARQARMRDNKPMGHLTTDQLNEGLDHIKAAPSDIGSVEMVVRRPETDQREVLDAGEMVVGEGLAGDNYRARGGSKPDSPAHPEAQINIMGSRAIDVICSGDKDRWQWAGDQLLVDFDISETNTPPGTRLKIGEAVLEVSQKPHHGCAKFADRFGLDAARWVNSDEGTELKLRGINAMVIEAGTVKPGDAISKL